MTPDPPHEKAPTGFAIAASCPAWNWRKGRLDPSFRWDDEYSVIRICSILYTVEGLQGAIEPAANRSAELYTREARGWHLDTVTTPDESLDLTALDMTLRLADLYRSTELLQGP